MSISLRPTSAGDLEGEVFGHDYRLSEEQFRAAIEAGIIPAADRVELQDGFLRLRGIPSDPDSGGDYRLSVEQYEAMVEGYVFTMDDRVELLDGWLVVQMSKNRPHEISKGLTQDAIRALLPPDWVLAIESPVIASRSMPEPDLSVVRGARRDYAKQTPGPDNIALLIEVADASRWRDRRAKKRQYAEAGFKAFWLVNLVHLQIEVYTSPTELTGKPDYLTRQDFGPDDMIPVIIDGYQAGLLAVRDLLP